EFRRVLFRSVTPGVAGVGVRAALAGVPLRTGRAGADDREVREAGFESEAVSDLRSDWVELLGRERLDGSAALAEQVLALADAEQGVEAGAMAEMNVAHEPLALQRLQVAVDRGHVEPAPKRDLLGRDGPFGGEQRLQHQPPGSGQAKPALAEDGHSLVEVAACQRWGIGGDGHGLNSRSR